MSRSGHALGRAGEDIAAEHLKRLGYRNVERNVRFRLGELDIVAWDGSVLVFVEVRTRRSGRAGTPAESVDLRKQRRLIGLAQAYVQSRGLERATCRFDVIAIDWSDKDNPRVQHLPNAFSVT